MSSKCISILALPIMLFPAIGSAEQGRPTGKGTYSSANPNSAYSSQSLTNTLSPWTGAPLAYSAGRSETASRIDELMRGAAALKTQGDFSKAMELYNEVLTLAPPYAEAYRQRALTLVRLGSPVQAQVDYNRYLALDPHAAAGPTRSVCSNRAVAHGRARWRPPRLATAHQLCPARHSACSHRLRYAGNR